LIVADQQAAQRLKRACIEMIKANPQPVSQTPDYVELVDQITEIMKSETK